MIHHKSRKKYGAAPPLRLIGGTLLLLGLIIALLVVSNVRECSVLAVSPTPTPNGMQGPQQGGMQGPQQGGMQGPQQGGGMQGMPQQGGMQGPQQGGGMQGPQQGGGMQGPQQGGMQGPQQGMQGPQQGMQGPRQGMQGPQQGMQGSQQGMQGSQQGMMQQGPRQGMQGSQQGMMQQGPQQGMMQQGPQQGMMQQGPQQGMQGMPQQQNSSGMIMKDSINFKYEDELRALHQDISFMEKNRKFKLSDVQKKKLIALLQQLSIKVKAMESIESSMNKVFNKSQKYLVINNPVNGYYYIPLLSNETGQSEISEDEVLTQVITLLGKKCTP